MKSFIYWLLVIAGGLGLWTWALHIGPAIASSIKDLVDMLAPEVDWPAWIVGGMVLTLILNI